MFPLNWNIPFIRKNGSRTTLGAITGDIAGIEEDVSDLTKKTDGLWDNMLDNGAVNMVDVTASTSVIDGVTWTVNADKTVNCNASGALAAAQTFQTVKNSDNFYLEPGSYHFSCCPPNGSDTTYRVELYNVTNSYRIGWDRGDGFDFTLTEKTQINSGINILSGYTPNNLTFKPMLSDPSLNLSYDDYVPYAMTNRELTEDVANLNTVIGGMNGYTAGDFNFIPPTVPYIQYVVNTSQWSNPIADAGTEGGSLMWIGRLDTQARLTQLFFCNNGAIYQRLLRSDNLTEYTYGNWNKNTV